MPVKLEELLVAIQYDGSKADRGLSDTEKKVKQLGDEFERTENKSKKSTKGIGDAVDDLNRKSKKLSLYEQFSRAQDAQVDSFKSKIVGLGQSVGLTMNEMAGLAAVAPAVGLAATAAGAGFLYATHNAIEYASSLKDLSQETGVGVETLSVLNVAARQAGIGIDSAAAAASKYFVRLSEAAHGSEEAEKIFTRFGINAKKAILDPDQALKDLLTRLSQIPNAAERTEAALKLAGKGGKELAAISLEMDGNWQRLEQTARSLGVTIDRDLADKADQFGDTVELMKMKAEGAFLDIARGALPGLQRAVDELTEKNRGNSDSWQQLGRDMGDFAIGAANVISAIQQVGSWLKWMEDRAASSGAAVHDALLSKKSYAGQAWDWVGGRLGQYGWGGPEKPIYGVYASSLYKEGWDKPTANTTPPPPGALTSPNIPRGGGGSRVGGGNPDKALQDRLRLLQIESRAVQMMYDIELDVIERFYDRSLSSLEEYVSASLKAESDRFTETSRILHQELGLAEKASKDRNIKVAEANQKIQEENRRHGQAIDKIFDAQYRAQEEAARRHEDALLRIKDQRLQNEITRIRMGAGGAESMDDVRRMAHTLQPWEKYEASRDVTKLQIIGIDNHIAALKRELQQKRANAQESQRITDQIKQLVQDRVAAELQGIEAERQAQLEYSEFVRDILERRESELQSDLEEQLAQLQEFSGQITGLLRAGFDEGWDGILQGFQQLLNDMVDQLINSLLFATLARLFKIDTGNSFLEDAFGIFGFADGGRPPVGRPSIVGERGPELFVPDGAGTIIPNHQLGGGGGTYVFNFSLPNVRNPQEFREHAPQAVRRALMTVNKERARN